MSQQQQQQGGGGGAAAAPGATSSRTPADFLRSIRGKPVVVRLNSGADYRGILACLDGYMNVALEQTEEYVGGQLKNSYGDAFLRGNNVLYIAAADGGGSVGGAGGGGGGK
jgi:U6 snRNA-associated Sm-like protein LSm6